MLTHRGFIPDCHWAVFALSSTQAQEEFFFFLQDKLGGTVVGRWGGLVSYRLHTLVLTPGSYQE